MEITDQRIGSHCSEPGKHSTEILTQKFVDVHKR
jgi:hypothetical protein